MKLLKPIILIALPNLFYVSFGINGLFVPSILMAIVFGQFSSKESIKVSRNNRFFIFILFIYTSIAIFASATIIKPLFSFLLILALVLNAQKIRQGLEYYLITVKGRRLVQKIFISIGILNLFFENRIFGYSELNDPFFPFSEPSHYFLSFSPWILPLKKDNSQSNWLVLGTIIIISLFEESLLGLVLGVLGLALSYPKSTLGVILLFGIPIINYLLSSDYFNERILLDTQNLTAAVWVLGWHEVIANSFKSYFLGSGFQTLGLNGHSSDFAYNLLKIFSEFDSINLYDGGFLFVKIFSEFGLISLFYILGVISFLGKNSYWGLCLAFLVDLFLRGQGYGSIPFIISLVFYLTRKLKYV